MTKSVLTILLFTFGLTNSYAQLSRAEYENVVKDFVDCIKRTDIDKLDSIISYPIKRSYPILPINNKQELKKRYSEIFDDNLISMITSSNIKEDWSDVGSRGIMLNSGIIWLDYDGRLIRTNYTSDKEKAIKEELIESERSLLYVELRDFKEPVHTIETSKFIVRIDLSENLNYRYASWSKKSDMASKPDLVINNGKFDIDGRGGDHHYTFKNGAYNYVVYVNVMGADDTPPFELEVSKNDKVILNQPAKLKKLR